MYITSSFVVSEPQADGRCYVRELHVTEDGRKVEPEYLWDGVLDPELVMEERAADIARQLEARAAARAAVVGTEVPRTKYEFLELFSSIERQSIRRRSMTDANVLDFMEMLNASGGVFRSKAWPGLMYLAHVGEITFERADAILEQM